MMIPIVTSWGTITVGLEEGAVTECRMPPLRETPAEAFRFLRRSGGTCAEEYVRDLLAGKPAEIPLLRFPAGTPFQQSVWQAVCRIPFGETRSYGEVAEAIGRPRSCRAVANACGANLIPLFIPCHRVTAKNGLGGYTPGTVWKTLLFQAES